MLKPLPGQCLCGQTQITLRLTNALSEYSPRACDCDFCTERKIHYLSDAKGALYIHFSAPYAVLKQGSNQAEFLTCSGCGMVIAATLRDGNQVRGALNAHVLEAHEHLLPPVVVSPKQLSAEEKRQRWSEVWMPVKIEGQALSTNT